MIFQKVDYKTDLNHRQKENYNFHKIAAVLADYGFNSIRLSDDYEGADFLAIHINNSDILKVQLKGRLTFEQKYIGKNLFICFPHLGAWYLYPHDELWAKVSEIHNAKNSPSWLTGGAYNFPSPSTAIMGLLNEYRLSDLSA
ncbi:hypothetical protein [Arsenicibacter rosenii]|jgi:hypothetical protein|uniref:Uncharacterized protein n=1 Tax=Arsenicibacter rosenii TaxID=1750698 RepID=A0A1S2VAV2_9BACT|nr:hypothetical protein [Arsenicibacter rosenii]OIN55789.1 hypothetical protein BLX24_28270 [Arsenicibacter rosenii]